MSCRRLILMVSLVGLIGPGAIADESKIDKKLANEAPLFERIKLRGLRRGQAWFSVFSVLGWYDRSSIPADQGVYWHAPTASC